MIPWTAAQYTKFESERSRAVRDLLAHVTHCVASAADIGCGPGNSTEVLIAQYPGAAVTGVDSSPDMIAAARKRLPQVRFEIGDIAEWRGGEKPLDLILANAVLQWLPDHASLLPALIGMLAHGGSLAVQVPDNLAEAAHRLMRDIATDAAFAGKLPASAGTRAVRHTPDWYYRVLRASGATADIWQTTYYHVLSGADAVVEWFKGSGLRPFLEPLSDAERALFLARYRAGIVAAYPAQADGTVLLPFPRLFFIATR